MTDFSSTSFPPPKDWQAFERHARLLFEHLLGDPQTQNNGRAGQPQHGVDIFGRRGGNGRQVGVQCKGKDSEYGGAVTEAELRREVEKSAAFSPAIEEFILITTAADDARIQEAARLLELEVRGKGRNLTIAVWGWGHLHQQIVRYPDALRAFHPDAYPFTDTILSEVRETRSEVAKLETLVRMLTTHRAEPTRIIGVDSQPDDNPVEKILNRQIDGYRDLLKGGKPRTAIELLTKLSNDLEAGASNKIRFRILTNLGVARHQVGERDIAADCFLAAAELDNDSPVSLANKVAALLIKGRLEEARTAAEGAVKSYPQDAGVGLQRLQARREDETVDAAWNALDPSVRANPDLIEVRVRLLREEGADWKSAADEAWGAHSEHVGIRILHAEAVLDRIISDQPVVDGPEISQADVLAAAQAMEELWNKLAATEAPLDMHLPHNAALLLLSIDKIEEAATLLDASIRAGNTSVESKRLRIGIYVSQRNIKAAAALADELPDSPMSKVIRAELRVSENPAEALAILDDRARFTDYMDVIGASDICVECLIALNRLDDAVQEAERLRSALQDDPLGYSALYRAKAARGDKDAHDVLSVAVAKVVETTSFRTRFFLCQALYKSTRFDAVVELLHLHVPLSHDNPALQLLVTACVDADRPVVLQGLLGSLPSHVQELPFFRRAQISLSMRSGDLNVAEDRIRSYLGIDGRSLPMQLNLLQVLLHADKLDELKRQIARPASDFDGTPQQLMFLAQFKEAFGDWREAYSLAYKTLLPNRQNSSVVLAYIGLMLRSGHKRELVIEPEIVAEGTAVGIEVPQGNEVYIIEANPNLRPSAGYVSMDHQVAKVLVAQRVGFQVCLPDGTSGKIAWIKPKELFALHEAIGSFKNQFPEEEGLERVRIDANKPGGLQPIFERVRARSEAIDRGFDRFEKGGIPFAFVAAMHGAPLDGFLAYIASGRVFRVCEGSHDERSAAFDAIDANGKRGCVVDEITLHIIQRLKLERAVAAICGPIGVTPIVLARVRTKIDELESRKDEPDMSLVWHEGQIARVEHSVEDKKEVLAQLYQMRDWIVNSTTTLPITGSREPSPVIRKVMSEFGPEFAEDVVAAQGAGRLLVSEDFALRQLAKVEFGVNGAWLQPILIRAMAEHKMTNAEYLAAVNTFVASNFEFITIDAALLNSALAGVETVPLPREFQKLADRLGGKAADVPTNLRIGVQLVYSIWKVKPWLVCQAVLIKLLNVLTHERSDAERNQIVSSFYAAARPLKDNRIIEVLEKWRKGDFSIIR